MQEWPGPDQLAVYDPTRQPSRVETPAERRARIARLRCDDGLPVSDEIVSEVLAFNERDGSSGWFTERERHDIYGDSERVEQTRALLASAADVLSRIEVGWSDGQRIVRVLVTGDTERHRRRLAAALGADRVRVDRARFAEQELRGVAERVNADADGLAKQGIYLARSATTPEGLELDYYAADFDRADALLRDRYGALAQLHYRGASRYCIREHPFGSWHADENRLHIFYALARNGERPGSATVIEQPDSVIVSVTILDWRGAKTLRGGFVASQLTVELRAPLGERAVIDNSENRTRPHWSQAAKTVLPRPQDM